jgi:hypothetical protein
MGQIGKRLQIIKIAISLTDAETIAMQCSKLRLHKEDKLLRTILSVLDDENYAQATMLIDRYLQGPQGGEEQKEEEETAPKKEEAESDALLYSQEEEQALKEAARQRSEEEEALIRKFGLFMEKAKEQEYNPLDEEEALLNVHHEPETTQTITPEEEDDLLTLPPKQPTTEEIMEQFRSIDEEQLPKSDTMSHGPLKQPYYESEEEEVVPEPAATTKEPEEDLDFEIDEIPLTQPYESETDEREVSYETPALETEPPAIQEEEGIEEEYEEPEMPKIETAESSLPQEGSGSIEEEHGEKAVETQESPTYSAISYIDQKFRNMRNQYPQVEESSESFESVERLLYKISLEGYSEADIVAAIDKVFELKEEGKLAEAAHLLLISAATESIYGQFILARELYRGDILQKNLPEAFTQINRLAMDDYPDAVCDLAQFYEFGIGIPKDKKKAFSLYEDALELGVERAEKHLQRMENASRGILGKLFKKK